MESLFFCKCPNWVYPIAHCTCVFYRSWSVYVTSSDETNGTIEIDLIVLWVTWRVLTRYWWVISRGQLRQNANVSSSEYSLIYSSIYWDNIECSLPSSCLNIKVILVIIIIIIILFLFFFPSSSFFLSPPSPFPFPRPWYFVQSAVNEEQIMCSEVAMLRGRLGPLCGRFDGQGSQWRALSSSFAYSCVW